MMLRRGFLKGLAIAPVVAGGAARALASSRAGLGGLGAGVAGNISDYPQPISNNNVKYISFLKWFKDHGDKRAREEAANVQTLDPDLAESRLPLGTRVRMQRKRDYERIIAKDETWFEDKIKRTGFYEQWIG